MRRRAVVTGSSGLVGSEIVAHLDARGWLVEGIDNNMRRVFLGKGGDTRRNLDRLRSCTTRFSHHDVDIRDRGLVDAIVADVRPHVVVHAAAQPSHALAGGRPLENFDVNTVGTLNVLEAVRCRVPEATFVFLSSNKVYGDAPNRLGLIEHATRWEFADSTFLDGLDETLDATGALRTPFGASKAAAELFVQEYGRYFGIPTVCFRAGCITGVHHAGTEQHGFLAYLAAAALKRHTYRIFGYRGKQVRDNIHSSDVCSAIEAFVSAPTVAAVYNLGGGRSRSVSVLEAVARFEDLLGCRLKTEYVDEARRGDHICYISDTAAFRAAYPGWEPSVSLDDIFRELAQVEDNKARASSR
jgi:CDP-paratose 2-epimerase